MPHLPAGMMQQVMEVLQCMARQGVLMAQNATIVTDMGILNKRDMTMFSFQDIKIGVRHTWNLLQGTCKAIKIFLMSDTTKQDNLSMVQDLRCNIRRAMISKIHMVNKMEMISIARHTTKGGDHPRYPTLMEGSQCPLSTINLLFIKGSLPLCTANIMPGMRGLHLTSSNKIP